MPVRVSLNDKCPIVLKMRVVKCHYLEDKGTSELLSGLQVENMKITPDKEIEENEN